MLFSLTNPEIAIMMMGVFLFANMVVVDLKKGV